MHSGTVVGRRNSLDPGKYDEYRTWGNYGIIECVLDGEVIRFRYAHLNAVSVSNGSSIYAGQKIGLTGNTGNAQTKGDIIVIPHVHVQARKVVNGQQVKINPNDYMATKFNSDGTINTSASSCY